MSRFVLTAQLQLQAPTNVRQVVNQIQSQLNNVQVNVQVQGSAQATRQINQVTQATQQASNAASQLGRNFGVSIKRFAAFTIATRAVSLFTSTLSKAVEEAIAFERELIKISQVTGKSISQLRDLTNEITRLSTSLGVSSTSLLSTSRILSQAGLSADETRIALDALAKSQLAPTFDDIGQTAEGVVAIFNQFQAGAEALEAQLGAINAVAGKFAVEAGDLISVVRRTGGVFRAAGGELNELIALFTSVRATTRESAESIATGLRTIFTRIQRPKTIEFLRQYGVELLDLEGKFVGPFEATRRLSEALAGLEQGDISFVRIAEELGGFRQIGKVIPLLQQFRVAQEALNVAQAGSGSLADDAAKAQASLAVRITKVKEEFLALVRSISESTSFQLFANTALNLASALIKLADALKPVLPLLVAFAGIKLATGFGSFVRGIGGGLQSPRAFATGGLVPGSGNRDTVPAMLTPGEFVIRKSSVAKLGVGNLAAMNENRYAAGGEVVLRVKPNKFGGMFLSPPTEGDSSINAPTGRLVGKTYSDSLIQKLQMSGQFSGLGAGVLGQTAPKRGGAILSNDPTLRGQQTREVKLYDSRNPNKPTAEFASFVKNNSRAFNTTNQTVNRQSKTIKRLEAQFLGNIPMQAKLPSKVKSVKIAADSGSIPSLISNTSDMNVGLQDEITQIAYNGMKNMVTSVLSSSTLTNKIGPERLKKIRPNIKKSVAKLFNNDPEGKINSARAAIEGYLFEGIVGGITGSFPQSAGALFDFTYPGRGDPEGWTDLFGPQGAAKIALLTAADARRSATKSNKEGIVDKAGKYLATNVSPGLLSQFVTVDPIRKALGGLIKKLAAGGIVNAGRNLYGDAQDPNLASPKQVAFIESLLSQFQKTVGAPHPSTSMWMPPDSKAAASNIISKLKATIPELPLIKQFFGKGINYGGGAGSGFVVTKFPPMGRVQQRPLSQFGGNITQIQEYIKRGELAFGSNAPSARGPSSGSSTSRLRTRSNYGRSGYRYALGGLIKEFASGGNVGTDTVPALLTPGEFVINRSAAQKIGYGSLNRMNKVGKYANGGVVQKFAKGGSASNASNSGNAMLALSILPATIQSLLPPIDETSSGLSKATNKLLTLATTITSVTFALQAFGVSLTASKIGSFFGKGKGGAGDLLGGFQRQGSAIPFRGTTTRRAGAGFGEGFSLAGERDRRARILRSARSSVGDDLTLKGNIRSRNLSTRLTRPTALTGRAGALLARSPLGGIASRIGGSSTVQIIGKIFGPLTKVIGPLVGGFAAMLGPILAIAGIGAAINSIVSGFRDLDGKLKDAVKAEDTARAQQLAVSKAASDSIPIIGDIVGAIGDAFGPGTSEAIVGFMSYFGGPSVASIKANINAQIESAKAQKSLKETAEKAAEAMKEFEAGNISAAEAAKAAAASSQAIYQSRLATEAANRANTAQRSEGGFAVARNIFTLGGVFGETAEQRNRRIDQENQQRTDEQKKLEDEQFKVAQPALNAFGRQLAATGGNFDQFKEQLLAMGFSADFVRRKEDELSKSFENIAKEAERTKKAFDAMNLGFRNIQSVSGALSVSMNNYLASQEAGYNQLENVITTLEASVTSAAAGISDEDFGSALGFAAAGLRDLGASNQQINKFTENLTAINKAQQVFAQASEEAKQALIDEFKRGVAGQSGAGPTREKFAEVIANQLEQAGIGEATRERIKDALANADISQDDLNAILAGDISVLDKVLNDLGETTLKQVIGPLKELAKYEQQLAKLTQNRLEMENKVIAAQKNMIEAQMEAAEIIAKYGGPAFTPDMKAQGIIAQANIEGQAAGVSPMLSGSAGELNRRNAQIRTGLSDIANIRAMAAAGDKGAQQQLSGQNGVNLAAQEKRLQDLAKSEYDTTKRLIGLKEQELKLISEKNRLEKSSIEALVTGDINKFFEQQAAVGARASIALGSNRLQGAYGANALGAAAQDIQRLQEAGIQTLYGQQIGGTGGLAERGFAAALSARGVGRGAALNMASTAAGTTAEEEALKGEIRSLASTLPNYAAIQLQTAQQDLAVADIQMQAAEKQLEAAKANAKARGVDIAGMAKGGVVYANRGIFIPKGTDTVPAMLTPGEFVVRREAVRRGNNLQLLQSMNRGQSGVSTNGTGAVAMASGGVVRYRQNGSNGPETSGGGFGLSADVVNKLSTALNSFNSALSANIDKLNNTSFNVKLDTTNINVNLTGGTFLSRMQDDIQEKLFQQIGQEIISYKVGPDGNLKKKTGVTN